METIWIRVLHDPIDWLRRILMVSSLRMNAFIIYIYPDICLVQMEMHYFPQLNET